MKERGFGQLGGQMGPLERMQVETPAVAEDLRSIVPERGKDYDFDGCQDGQLDSTWRNRIQLKRRCVILC